MLLGGGRECAAPAFRRPEAMHGRVYCGGRPSRRFARNGDKGAHRTPTGRASTRPALEMDEEPFFEFCQLNREWRIERSAEGDLPGRGKGRSFFERSDAGHVDLPRAVEGGFGGGFFACYVPTQRPVAGARSPPSPSTRAVTRARARRRSTRLTLGILRRNWRRACFGSKSNPKGS